MTDRPASLSAQYPDPSQTASTIVAAAPLEHAIDKGEVVEEEPYTIKCICNFADDDGSTIFCETCETWQHIDCFYPDNREEVSREDFAHSCADCKPRQLDTQRAIERILQLRNPTLEGPSEKKTKRPPSKSHKKRSKPSEAQVNGHTVPSEHAKMNTAGENPPTAKKTKTSHKSSQSISSQQAKRSPSYGNSRPTLVHPPSPATTPPDLPDDFQIHHYSEGFYSLYNEHNVPESHSNKFVNLAIPTALARWLHEPDILKQEVGRTHQEVFQEEPSDEEAKRPTLEVEDATRAINADTTLRWRFLKSTTPIEKDVLLAELNGEIGFQKDYCIEPDNLWMDLSSPLPFVFFHPLLPLYIDTRKEGSLARYVRRSCKPNAQLDTYLSSGSEYHFWLVSDRHIAPNEQITLPWDFRLEKSVGPRWLHLLGLSDDDSTNSEEPEMDHTEYTAISNWIDRILSEYGGCACDLDNDCAFARFHRHYLHVKNSSRSSTKKKQRKPRAQAMSPSSTGHATNSRAASEGQPDNGPDQDGRSQSGSSRSKPPSRDPTPLRQGSFDQLGILTEPTDRDKRKVAMVEDSFRRMEQQQPPRKKKRTSDGTTVSNSSKTKRAGSTSHGSYVDAGTCRSKSGSPITAHSPHFPNSSRNSVANRPPSVNRSRPSSAGLRPTYCNAGVQTDPVPGEWYSDSKTSPRPKKKIIPLARRLLNCKQRMQCDDDQTRKHLLTPRASSASVMDIESPKSTKSTTTGSNDETVSPLMPRAKDVLMIDTATASTPPKVLPIVPIKAKTPELRVQMPPVPAFDSHGSTGPGQNTTPLSATSSIAQSPLSAISLSTPFGPPGINGVAVLPSPAKKKLSLSDYTKRSKAAGKAPNGPTIVKPTLPSPEEGKMASIDAQLVQADEEPSPLAKEATNGHL